MPARIPFCISAAAFSAYISHYRWNLVQSIDIPSLFFLSTSIGCSRLFSRLLFVPVFVSVWDWDRIERVEWRDLLHKYLLTKKDKQLDYIVNDNCIMIMHNKKREELDALIFNTSSKSHIHIGSLCNLWKMRCNRRKGWFRRDVLIAHNCGKLNRSVRW